MARTQRRRHLIASTALALALVCGTTAKASDNPLADNPIPAAAALTYNRKCHDDWLPKIPSRMLDATRKEIGSHDPTAVADAILLAERSEHDSHLAFCTGVAKALIEIIEKDPSMADQPKQEH